MAINIKWLQAFRAVVSSGTVTAAADVLCVTQPAVSRMIGHLEAELDFPLFTRRGGRLTITQQGEAFYQEVERALGGLDGMAQIGRNIRQGVSNCFRLFVMSPLMPDVIPEAMARMMKEYPSLVASIDIRNRRDVEQWIPGNQFDLGLVLLPVERLGRNSSPLVRAPVSVVMPRGHRLAEHAAIDLAALAEEPMIMLPATALLRRWIDGKFAEVGLAPVVKIETSTMSSACILAGMGLGVALADAFTIRSVQHRGLVVRPLSPPMNVTFGYVLPNDTPTGPLASRFIEIVGEVARATLGEAEPPREVRRVV